MPRTNRLLVLAVLSLVLLAGCSGAGPAGGGGGAPGTAAADGSAEGAPGQGGGDAPSRAGADERRAFATRVESRAIVRTGRVRLRVEDFDRARRRLVRVAEERDGFVAGSSETTHREGNRTWTEGRLTLRVPTGQFAGAYRAVKGVGRVKHAESNATDVTDRLVDIDARLENLRAQRDRLRRLYEEANGTKAVLRVGKRLSSVQERIERLTAKRRALEREVAYATITVRFGEPRPGRTPTPTPASAYHETALVAAFLASVDGVVVAVRTAAVTLAYLLPYLLAFGLPLGGLGVVVYGWRRAEPLFEDGKD